MSPRAKIAAIAAAVLLVLAGWWLLRPSSPPVVAAKEKDAGGSKALTAQQLERMGVKTAVAKVATGVPLGTMPATVSLPPEARVAVTAPFPGAIRQVYVIAGQSVSRGQPLATMISRDAVQFGSSLTRAQAQLSYARANANRIEQLVREGIVAGARAQEARAAVRQAEVDVSENGRILKGAGASGDGSITLRAPISGRVSVVAVQTGGPVDGMTAPFVIDASNAYQLDIQIPERLTGMVKPGMAVTLPGNIAGKILLVGSAIDPETRSILAKASISAAPGIITGKLVMVSVDGGAMPNSIAVPSNAVTRLDGADVVFVKTAKGFIQRTVVIGGSAGGETVVTEGLAAGEEVAISGLTEIKMTLSGD